MYNECLSASLWETFGTRTILLELRFSLSLLKHSVTVQLRPARGVLVTHVILAAHNKENRQANEILFNINEKFCGAH